MEWTYTLERYFLLLKIKSCPQYFGEPSATFHRVSCFMLGEGRGVASSGFSCKLCQVWFGGIHPDRFTPHSQTCWSQKALNFWVNTLLEVKFQPVFATSALHVKTQKTHVGSLVALPSLNYLMHLINQVKEQHSLFKTC